MPNAKVLAKKQEEVQKYKEKFEKSKLVILADYRGINVSDDTKMRAGLRKSNTEYKITKNSILRHAVKEAKLDELEPLLEGPTAIAFSYEDYVDPAKVIYEYAKSSEFYKIKGGVMDGKVITVEEIERLAKLPSREMLLTQLATVLLANIRNFAVVLDQVRQKKEAEENA